MIASMGLQAGKAYAKHEATRIPLKEGRQKAIQAELLKDHTGLQLIHQLFVTDPNTAWEVGNQLYQPTVTDALSGAR
jgi:hypothetical protein